MNDFRNNPLSDKIVCALINATESYAKVNVLLNEFPSTKSALSVFLLSLDIYYSFYYAKPDILQICRNLYIQDQNSDITGIVDVISKCTKYANKKEQTTYVLTAIDLFRIDRAISTVSIAPLMVDDSSTEPEYKIEAVWTVLHNIYGPQRQYPLLLETSIAVCKLYLFSSEYRFNMQTLIILLSILYKNKFAFQGLHRQWVLSTDPRLDLDTLAYEDAIIHVLSVFQQMWEHLITLIRSINNKRDEISKLIHIEPFRQLSAGFYELLAENVCIRNKDVTEKLCVSSKTAIKNLKQLEQEQILSAVKKGRELFYFNNLFLDLLKQSIEVSDNGTKKP